MTAVPAVTPVTKPLSEPRVIKVLVLLHTPPPAVSASGTLTPVHTVPGPVMVVGERLTVTGSMAVQPVGKVNVMLLVPVAMPVTTPVPDPMVATPVLPLLHTPVLVSVRVMCAPTHNADGPPMLPGAGFTVTVVVL